MLIEAGADSEVRARTGAEGGWTPLRCAVAGAANAEIAELLLEHGAVPDDHDLYLAGFADDDHRCLELLLAHAANVREIARMALSAPISGNDVTGVRLLLEAGADPRRYLSDEDDPEQTSVLRGAVRSGCSAELVELLLVHGADPDLPGSDGRSPYALAVSLGRGDLAAMLLRYGAQDNASGSDRFLQACLLADSAAAARQLEREPYLLDRLGEPEQAVALIQAADVGNVAAVRLMLELGFVIDARDAADGSTALHAAAYAGSADVIRLLIERGADLTALDTRWGSAPVVWAVVGSGAQPGSNRAADWLASIRMLIEAGADVRDITLSPDDSKQPSSAVAELLIAHGANAGAPAAS
ncbi:MAG TPA: ankyrin repeat domain-containing protein [Streptosporangiaceae bacterium]|nr:ankyrin repeat domain-containing protein [Streptosporangiaceae bacterium]